MAEDALSRRILVCCHLVQRTLGTGYPESTYRRALTRELEKASLPFQRDVYLPVMYDGEEIDRIQADFVVNGMVVYVIARNTIEKPDIAVALACVKASTYPRGLIVNFGTDTLQTKHISLTPMM